LYRKQFPVRVAFAMTINKCQGQSLSRAAIYLPEPVFSHGQLYVAASRCSNPDTLTFMIIPNRETQGHDPTHGWFTQNVVYTESLTDT
jgi:hypothetical protein